VAPETQSVRSAHNADHTAPGDPSDFTELWRPSETTTSYRSPERILLERGQISQEQLDEAARKQRDNPRLSVLELLIQDSAIDEVVALQAVAAYFNLPFARVNPSDIHLDTFSLLPPDYLKSKSVLPIRQKEDRVVLGISDPADIFLIDDVKRRLQSELELTVIPPGDVARAVDELSTSPQKQVEDIIRGIAEDTVEVVNKEEEEVTDLEKIAGESPVIRYVNYLIFQAVNEGASDIHIEPGEGALRVRCRIDGVLFDQKPPPIQMHAAIISRLKIMANLDIAERRLPQDGRIRATVHNRHVELRVSTLPTTHGEKCVIRILDDRAIMVGLENLGMDASALETFQHQILQPHGIVLVTGPTGSGKTTTLYSALGVMDGDSLNISTVEDPVEYELPYANQVNVHETIGLTFAAALRSLLRQDPDIIMVGEIRDEETARIAVQASLTGHLVLSTLHTNDAPSSITRLINIGIEPYLISASVNACLAQRLVRRICENCKEPLHDLKPNVANYLREAGVQPDRAYHGTGCDKCRQTGYKGRTGLYEMLEMNEELRDLITGNPSLSDLRRASRQIGMRTLREDGLRKVLAGVTTVEEIMRVTET